MLFDTIVKPFYFIPTAEIEPVSIGISQYERLRTETPLNFFSRQLDETAKEMVALKYSLILIKLFWVISASLENDGGILRTH